MSPPISMSSILPKSAHSLSSCLPASVISGAPNRTRTADSNKEEVPIMPAINRNTLNVTAFIDYTPGEGTLEEEMDKLMREIEKKPVRTRIGVNFLRCPWNTEHTCPKEHMRNHILKCANIPMSLKEKHNLYQQKKLPMNQFIQCPYSKLHNMSFKTYLKHIRRCPDRKLDMDEQEMEMGAALFMNLKQIDLSVKVWTYYDRMTGKWNLKQIHEDIVSTFQSHAMTTSVNILQPNFDDSSLPEGISNSTLPKELNKLAICPFNNDHMVDWFKLHIHMASCSDRPKCVKRDNLVKRKKKSKVYTTFELKKLKEIKKFEEILFVLKRQKEPLNQYQIRDHMIFPRMKVEAVLKSLLRIYCKYPGLLDFYVSKAEFNLLEHNWHNDIMMKSESNPGVSKAPLPAQIVCLYNFTLLYKQVEIIGSAAPVIVKAKPETMQLDSDVEERIMEKEKEEKRRSDQKKRKRLQEDRVARKRKRREWGASSDDEENEYAFRSYGLKRRRNRRRRRRERREVVDYQEYMDQEAAKQEQLNQQKPEEAPVKKLPSETLRMARQKSETEDADEVLKDLETKLLMETVMKDNMPEEGQVVEKSSSKKAQQTMKKIPLQINPKVASKKGKEKEGERIKDVDHENEDTQKEEVEIMKPPNEAP